jgi:subtilisin family serine protease
VGIPRTWSSGRRLAAGLALCGLVGVVAVGTAGAGKQQKHLTGKGSIKVVSTYTGAKSASGRLAKSDPSLLGRTDSTLVPVMIKYDFDAVASYRGGVAGLAPTSPSVTKKKIKDNKAAAAAYRAHIAQQAFQISSSIQATVPGASIGRPFLNAYGGVSATVPANQVGSLLQVPGVVAVQKDALQQPLDDNTGFIGATAVWPSLGGAATAGSNVTVGVIDTGIWPEHPMMSAVGEPPPTNPAVPSCEFGDGSDPLLGPAFTCNNKLIGAYAKTDTYMALHGADPGEFCDNGTGQCSARDPEGHGTHTTTTAAGRCVTSAMLFGVQRGPVCGIAPAAHVIMYRVCLAAGCFGSDSVSAVDQAIVDGVDVINFSISGGGQPYADPVELAFLDAYDADISVNASAGNSGPGAGTSDHGGPWVTTVGASTGPRSFLTDVHFTADGGATFDITGNTVTNGIFEPTPVVLAESLPGEDSLCQSVLAAHTADGKVVLCKRGVNARVDKGYNVAQGGAAGMILYNVGNQDVETDNHWLPAAHVNGPDTALLAFVNGHTHVMVTFDQGTPQATPADVMAAFSSRGPISSSPTIKPDVTAPGVQVLAGMTPQPTGITNGPPGNFYQAIAGTSMSSPHSAGSSALVKAAHPDWDPSEIKSALMTSSSQAVVKEDGSTPSDPFDRGAGSVRVDRAVNPTLLFDENTADFMAAGSDPLDWIDLNMASIQSRTMSGQVTTSRTAINVTGKSQSMNVATTSDAGQIIVSKKEGKNGDLPKASSSIKFDSKKPTTFFVTISAPDAADGWHFGQITFSKAGLTSVVIPVAFNKTQGIVTLTNHCSPDTFAPKAGTSCNSTTTNLSSSTAHVNVQISASKGVTLSLGGGANAGKGKSGGVPTLHKGVITWAGDLTPAIAPTIDSITNVSGQGPTGGYFAINDTNCGCGSLKLSPGDDTITNISGFDPFYYGGELYSTIGIVSNGYLVLGGGTGSDIVFLPQTFPDPAAPNNVLAPFWSDLNPSNTGHGEIWVNEVAIGSEFWAVVDYENVANFDGQHQHSFEVWLRVAGGSAGTGPSSEKIIYSYGTPGGGPGDGASGQNYGAENRDGSSGKNMTDPGNGTEFSVNTSPPTPGGSASIDYGANASKIGTYQTLAEMTSNLTKGTTQVVQTLNVGAAVN